MRNIHGSFASAGRVMCGWEAILRIRSGSVTVTESGMRKGVLERTIPSGSGLDDIVCVSVCLGGEVVERWD